MFSDVQLDHGARWSVRAYFGGLVIIVLIPGLLFAGWLAHRSATMQRSQIEDQAHHRSREIVTAIDREIVNAQNLLAVLGTSAHLKSGDLEAFHRQVVDLSRRLEVQIVLRDPMLDRQVVHSAFPWGTALVQASPSERRKAEEQIRLTRQPAVTDLFFGPLVKKHIVGIVAPVYEGADIKYFLSVGLPARRFADILDVLQTESDRVIGVVDRNHMIVARSQRNDVYVGTRTVTPTPPDRQGVVRSTGRDGTLTHWYYRRSDVSGWSVAVGIPDHVLNAPLHLPWRDSRSAAAACC